MMAGWGAEDLVRNAVGLGVSLAYVLAVLGVSALLARRGWSAEGTRKLVHIALGGWWVIAAACFTSVWWAAALPAAFIAVNAWAWRRGALPFMARAGGRGPEGAPAAGAAAEETPGTVYYAVSLTLLALLSFGMGAPYVGALGVFCMAFGDGFAAVAGKRFGKRAVAGALAGSGSAGAGRAGAGKTLVGSGVMFAASFISCAAVLLAAGARGWEGAAPSFIADPGLPAAAAIALSLAVAAALAAAATLLEAASPAGLDNLSVPLGVSGLFAVVFLPAAPGTAAAAGVLLSGAVALASLRLRLLTVSAALGAVAVGALAFAIGGWPLWLLLMWFFGSSNVAAKLMARRRGPRPAPKREGPRRLRQVLANSVPFLACAVAHAATGQPWLLVVAAGALSASTADTWASEIGTYSARAPVQRGLSGGVSPLGLAATVAGAAATAFLVMLLFHAFGSAVPTDPAAFLFVVACGVVGSLLDSVLGVLLQAKYRPPDASVLVEAVPEAACALGSAAAPGDAAAPPAAGCSASAAAPAPAPGAGYTLVSGFAWVTNDAVNLLSGIAVVALGLLVAA